MLENLWNNRINFEKCYEYCGNLVSVKVVDHFRIRLHWPYEALNAMSSV